MSAKPNTRATENAVDRNGGLVWYRLHSEREEICEALLKEFRPGSEIPLGAEGTSQEDAVIAANWHRELLQARLRKVDDALDRLMSGSYGYCSNCGRRIEDTKLDFDLAMAFCIDCWEHQQSQRTDGVIDTKSQTGLQAIPMCASSDHSTNESPLSAGVALKTLAPFDTLCVRTRNSNYRIFVLDPKTGRALIEGGRHFVEPVEAMVNGSSCAATFKVGWIGIGLRIEFWIEGKLASTSPVQSFQIEHHAAAEPAFM